MEELDGGMCQHFNVISEEGAITSLQHLKCLIFGFEVLMHKGTEVGRVWCLQGAAVIPCGLWVGEAGSAERSAGKGREDRERAPLGVA